MHTRRELLQKAGLGFGALALTSLLADEGRLLADNGGVLSPVTRTGPVNVKSVIFLFMGGGPSQVDTWDPKPELAKLDGQDVPRSIAKDVPRIARSPLRSLFASPYRFRRQGQSGIPVSELFPEIGKRVDDLCVLRSCRHNTPIHAPAEYLSTTGTQVGDRPSLGAWLYYGLGSENQNLPGFLVLMSNQASMRAPSWSNGFLPARYQGTVVKPEGIPHLVLPADTSVTRRQAQLDLLSRLNEHHRERQVENSELEARIKSYELAFRMQTAAPEAFELTRETEETKLLYGMDVAESAEFGTHCLLARRMVERGVRFVQLRNSDWDAHGDLKKNHDATCKRVDRPIAGLLTDLKRRGLLESTLVIWGGEFGRTPTAENPGSPSPGRDHSPSGYSMWLAGGGVKGGQVIGATDPVGYAAVEKPIHPNDFHATILHALGIDQKNLFYRHNNRDEMVTVNGGNVVNEAFG
ncbi:MAG: DUF1501 domain-containing protein [Planctomycetes bacterium]|nr:DUF1501 domain-containing protein [Planctomycetota bacterium]